MRTEGSKCAAALAALVTLAVVAVPGGPPPLPPPTPAQMPVGSPVVGVTPINEASPTTAGEPCPPEPCAPCPSPRPAEACVPPTCPRVKVIIPPPEVIFRQSPPAPRFGTGCSPCQTSGCSTATIQAAAPSPQATAPLTYSTTYTVPYMTYSMVPAMGMSSGAQFGMGFTSGGVGFPLSGAMSVGPVGGAGLFAGPGGFAGTGFSGPGLPLGLGSLAGLGQSVSAQQSGLSETEIRLLRFLLGQSVSRAEAQDLGKRGAFASTRSDFASALAGENGGDAELEARLKAINGRITQLSEKLAEEHLQVVTKTTVIDQNIKMTDKDLEALKVRFDTVLEVLRKHKEIGEALKKTNLVSEPKED